MSHIIITDAQGTVAKILPEKGGTLVQLSRNGIDFLYEDPKNLDSTERPRCGIPFLFPMFGRLAEDTFFLDGKRYPMEIHGFAHISQWQVENCGKSCLHLSLEATEETLKMYPFRFRVELIFQLQGGRLSIHQVYRNLDDKIMPYSFGFHPYFQLKELSQTVFDITAAYQMDMITGKLLPFGRDAVRLPLAEGRPETGAAFAGVQGPVGIRLAQEKRQITMEFDDAFQNLVLWHPVGKPFVCVEPTNGVPNGLNTGHYLTLQPGEVKEADLHITVQTI